LRELLEIGKKRARVPFRILTPAEFRAALKDAR
jgi:hypothetical protein